MEGYRLIEDYGSYRQPVASVVEINGEKALYRNITDSHYFRKGDYCALFTDDIVIRWLEQNDTDVKTVMFDDGTKTLKVSLDQYKEIKPRRMNGRLQRGIPIDHFIPDKSLLIPKPEKERVIKIENN